MKLATWIVAAITLALTLAACDATRPAHHAARPPTRTLVHADAGIVAGTFMRVGGPLGADGSQPPSIPLKGTVILSANRHRILAVAVGKTGTFLLRLRPGVYQVLAQSPQLLEVLPSGATIESPCTSPVSVTVVAGRTVHLSLVCAVP
jgi:hypothetical protein